MGFSKTKFITKFALATLVAFTSNAAMAACSKKIKVLSFEKSVTLNTDGYTKVRIPLIVKCETRVGVTSSRSLVKRQTKTLKVKRLKKGKKGKKRNGSEEKRSERIEHFKAASRNRSRTALPSTAGSGIGRTNPNTSVGSRPSRTAPAATPTVQATPPRTETVPVVEAAPERTAPPAATPVVESSPPREVTPASEPNTVVSSTPERAEVPQATPTVEAAPERTTPAATPTVQASPERTTPAATPTVQASPERTTPAATPTVQASPERTTTPATNPTVGSTPNRTVPPAAAPTTSTGSRPDRTQAPTPNNTVGSRPDRTQPPAATPTVGSTPNRTIEPEEEEGPDLSRFENIVPGTAHYIDRPRLKTFWRDPSRERLKRDRFLDPFEERVDRTINELNRHEVKERVIERNPELSRLQFLTIELAPLSRYQERFGEVFLEETVPVRINGSNGQTINLNLNVINPVGTRRIRLN